MPPSGLRSAHTRKRIVEEETPSGVLNKWRRFILGMKEVNTSVSDSSCMRTTLLNQILTLSVHRMGMPIMISPCYPSWKMLDSPDLHFFYLVLQRFLLRTHHLN